MLNLVKWSDRVLRKKSPFHGEIEVMSTHLKTVRIKLEETDIQPPTAGFKASAGMVTDRARMTMPSWA